MQSDTHAAPAHPPMSRTGLLTWTALGLFSAVFLFSAIWSLADPDGAQDTMVHLGFPTYFLYPQIAAKIVGVAVILWGRNRTLSTFAFAGFLFDLLLAGGAHLAEGDSDIWLVAAALVIWTAAFLAARRRSPSPRR